MCKPASMVVTKDKVLYGTTSNSHSIIHDQHGLTDDKLPPDHVNVEIVPPEKGGIPQYDAPFDEWEYCVDQDILPDWYVAEHDEQRVRKVLPAGYHDHIELMNTDAPFVSFTGGDLSTLTGGDCSTLTGGHCSTLTGGDSSTLTGGGDSTLTGRHGSTLTGGDCSVLVWRYWIKGDYRVFVHIVADDEAGHKFTHQDGELIDLTLTEAASVRGE